MTKTPFIFLGSLCLAGCTVGPDYHAPQDSVPAAWVGTTTAPTTQASATTQQSAHLVQWWTTFDDPVLTSLVSQAIESNLSLRQAQSRIRQARAARGVVSSGFWPSLNASGSYTHSGSENGGNSRTTVVGPNGVVSSVGSSGSSSQDLFRAGLDAAWELDVFGGVRRDIEASDSDIRSAVEDRSDVLVSIAGEVALDYMDLRGFQRQLVIADENLEAQRHSADLTRRRFEGGFVSALDVANADSAVATTESQIPILESSRQQAIYALSVLVAKQPAALLDELSVDKPIPATPPEIPVGLPSDLLRRRPDIRRAEEQLHAATARIGVATADLFPKFTLTGSIGLQGNKLASLANWNSSFWSFGPSVNWNVFDAGRIRSNIEVQNALQEQALLGYQQTILTALQDVESSLVAYAKEQQHRSALARAVAANRRAVDLATQLYTQGQTDFLNVLSAQRSLYVSEDALVQSNRTVATNLVSLYKALGGGWETPDQTTDAHR